jgi:ATP synthase protein I
MTELSAHGVTRGSFESSDSEPGAPEAPFKTLTREEARALSARIPSVSPWRVVAAQTAAGLVCSAIAWCVTQGSGAAWSALYGAAAVVIPGALLARGMTRQAGVNPAAAAVRFMVWEAMKIGTAIAMLVIAAKVVPHLSWLVLLVTMVVCIKVNWVALLWRARAVDDKALQHHGS